MLQYYTDEELCKNILESDCWDELYRRHIKMLQTIVTKMYEKFSYIAERADFLQLAIEIMFKACKDFDPSKHTKLSTYMYGNVRMGLLSMVREGGHITCPQHKTAAQLYMRGHYRNEKKYDFEKKNNIIDCETRKKFKNKHELLGVHVDTMADIITISPTEDIFQNVVWHKKFMSEDELITQIDVNITVEKLPEIHYDVYKTFFVKENTAGETAQHLGISEKDVRRNIRNIRKHFKKYMVL